MEVERRKGGHLRLVRRQIIGIAPNNGCGSAAELRSPVASSAGAQPPGPAAWVADEVPRRLTASGTPSAATLAHKTTWRSHGRRHKAKLQKVLIRDGRVQCFGTVLLGLSFTLLAIDPRKRCCHPLPPPTRRMPAVIPDIREVIGQRGKRGEARRSHLTRNPQLRFEKMTPRLGLDAS